MVEIKAVEVNPHDCNDSDVVLVAMIRPRLLGRGTESGTLVGCSFAVPFKPFTKRISLELLKRQCYDVLVSLQKAT